MAEIMTELYQIYYEESQKESLYPFAIPYFNDTITPFFENVPIIELVLDSKADKIGVCSWQLMDKLKFHLPPKRELTMGVLESDFDVLLLSRNSKNHKMLARAEAWHSGFTETLFDILEHVGVARPVNDIRPECVVYFNHFVAKREIYLRYVNECLAPAIAYMQNDLLIKIELWKDSGYTTLKGSIPENIQRMGVLSLSTLSYVKDCFHAG